MDQRELLKKRDAPREGSCFRHQSHHGDSALGVARSCACYSVQRCTDALPAFVAQELAMCVMSSGELPLNAE